MSEVKAEEIKPVSFKKKTVKEDKFWEKWFQNHEVFYLPVDKQREVILNPGKKEVWFDKTYPVKGRVVLSRKIYISDLPRNTLAKVVAVTAVPVNDKKFAAIRDKIPYREHSAKGHLKPKPQGTFYELVEASGGRYWTNPSEYVNVKGKATKNEQRK